MKRLLTVFVLLALILQIAPCAATEADGGIKLAPVKEQLDPYKPYDAYQYGLFEDQSIEITSTYRNGDSAYPVEAEYSWVTYIPDGFQVKSSVYIILIPDGMTAEQFASSDTGMEWIGLADSDEDPFAVVFVEPEDGGTWNLAQRPDATGNGRDEVAGAFAVYTAVRDKAAVANVFLSADKSGVRLVGYEEGASAAALWAATWPQIFANLTLINPTVSASNAEPWLDEYIFPFSVHMTRKASILCGKTGL